MSAHPQIDKSERRRSYHRWKRSFDLFYGLGDRLARGHAHEISEGGLAFSGAEQYPVGTKIKVEFWLHSIYVSEKFAVLATIRRREGKLMAIEFQSLSLGDRINILRVVKPQDFDQE